MIFVDRLNKIRELNSGNTEFVNKDLYKLLIKSDSLIVAYEMIKSNKGSITPGVGTKTLDAFSKKRLDSLIYELQSESWTPTPARRIYIPKPGKMEKRPLGIQGPEEKIVQSAMNIILDAIYEPVFSPHSFGFRPKIGCHNALKSIEESYDGMTFAIEGDIKGMYDNVNHHTLISLLQKKIDDDRFIRLVWKLLRAGYMDDGQYISSNIGTPQGSIVSPILANIYLHELDNFMAKRSLEIEVRNPKVRTSMYKKLDNGMRRIKHKLPKLLYQERSNALRELRSLKIESLKGKMYCDPSERIMYTRYADDFIIGIAGSYDLANQIKEEIREFLNSLSLTLSVEKTKITDIRKDYAFFLGYRIFIDTSVKMGIIHPKKSSPHLKRVTGRLVKLVAPIDRMVARLNSKDFCDSKGNPTPRKLWSTQEDNQIISLYNTTSRGIFGYYSGAHKKASLSRIKYIMKFSCALTLAFKHRCSLKKIFTKHGKDLTVSFGNDGEKVVLLYNPDLKGVKRKWQLGNGLPDPYRHVAFRSSRTKIDTSCVLCGASSVEMHHIRHVKDSKDGFNTKIMGLINRKQIPVCAFCHDLIHAGMYDGIALKDVKLLGLAKR